MSSCVLTLASAGAAAAITLAAMGTANLAGMATSDVAGTFSIGGLSPGSYDASVHADGYTDQTRRGVTVAELELSCVAPVSPPSFTVNVRFGVMAADWCRTGTVTYCTVEPGANVTVAEVAV